MQFSSTPRGARLARRLAGYSLDEWGHPYGGNTHDTVTLLIAELASNAVQHGHVPGRDFQLRLTADESVIRIEVSDTRTEKRPTAAAPPPDSTEVAESGRGLLLVSVLATDRGVTERPGAPGKTVWAKYELPGQHGDHG